MKNIWKIFTKDVKQLVKQPFALIIIIGLCVIPSLYAWFNIFANWDPYANTGGIPVAVVSLDQDYTLKDGSVVNMGESVLESLHSNTSVKWIFPDTEEEAEEGVESGKYYAAIVITDKFTYSMYNVFKENFKNPTITYYENEKRNAVATKITDTAVSTVKQSINEKFIEVVASTIFTQTNELSSEMENQDVFSEFEGKLTNLNNNLIGYSDMIDEFISANAVLEAEIKTADGELPKLSSQIQNGEKSFQNSQSNLNSTKTSLENFSSNVQTTLDGINHSINSITTDINNANLAQNAQSTADNLNKTATDTAELIRQLNQLKKSLADQAANSSGTTGSARNRYPSVVSLLVPYLFIMFT